ncbi:MAG TPA: sigma-70 family RNA polymerase sigma factor [Terriglobales bacterium]|nr:sigma-70 family RNA polymerase sigma factor [Terriglobales bacterium]
MAAGQNPEKTQLSRPERVETDVASMAIKSDGMAAAIEQNFPARAGARLSPPARKGIALEKGVALEELTDAEIMLRVGAGDDAAFDYLVEKFRRPVVSFMYRMAHNQAVAEELAQEVFLRVYRSRTTYAAEAKFTTWLYRIATNLAVNHARDTKSERTAPSVSLDEPDEETGSRLDVADKNLTAEQQMLRQERLAAIKQHVMELPERQRLAVLMHKYQEMDYREIAEVLKLSESATKSLLFRAYETLREKLKGFV